MNSINLIGNITKDIELRSTTSGKSVVELNIAVNGIGENEVVYIPVVVWEKQAENVAKYCSKGSKIGVSGKLIQSEYETQDGAKRRITKVQASHIEFLTRPVEKKESNDPLEDFSNDIEVTEDSDLPF